MPDKRILIVEDETIVAMTLEDALHGMGVFGGRHRLHSRGCNKNGRRGAS